ELGCRVTMSEKVDDGYYDDEWTIEELMDSIGPHIMITRTYPEDDSEDDYYHFESSDIEKNGELLDFEINLSRNKLSLLFDSEEFIVKFNIGNKKFEELKAALEIIVGEKGKLNLQD
ncbi:hypothetical protein LJC67_07405, partial [Bacteroidales bacterium OttesenSCG-928-A14]|nr:hypothetical protein [Bacteroidales bacterium OttesenSCG-928-A14]